MPTMLLFVLFCMIVLLLLGLMLWFVSRVLHQQSLSMSHETGKLREMLLDLLSEQEAVTLRQTQLGSSLALLRGQIEQLGRSSEAHPANSTLSQIEGRLGDLQQQVQSWASRRDMSAANAARDNESWAYLLSLLSSIQDRIGALSTERSQMIDVATTTALLEGLDREMQHLTSIADDIDKLQRRLRHSLEEREPIGSTPRFVLRDGVRFSNP